MVPVGCISIGILSYGGFGVGLASWGLYSVGWLAVGIGSLGWYARGETVAFGGYAWGCRAYGVCFASSFIQPPHEPMARLLFAKRRNGSEEEEKAGDGEHGRR